MEEWRDIEGYEGLYQVSNFGRVRSLDRLAWNHNGYVPKKGVFLVSRANATGHHTVNLSKNGKSKMFFVHRLVAFAFIPNPDNLPIINHKDENPSNNSVENLEWCSYKYNTNYGTCKERIAKANGLKIEQYTLDGKYVTTFNSAADAGRALGKSQSAIAVVARGGGYWSRWKFYKAKQAYGYIWRYVKLKEEGII